MISYIQKIKFKKSNSKPADGREAPLWSRRNFHATNEKLRNHNCSKIWCVKTVASPIKFKKSAKLALCDIWGSQKAKIFIFIKKDITIWLKLGRFVIVYDLTKWVKPLFSNFFFFSAFNRLGLIYLYYGFCDDRNISAISQIFYRNRNNPLSFTHDQIYSYSLYSVDTKSRNQMMRIAWSISMRV